MTEFKGLGRASTERLLTCDPRLVQLVCAVAAKHSITVLCGHRDEKEQEQAFLDKKSKVHFPHSKHNTSPSQAIDIAPWPIDWSDKKSFEALALVVKEHAAALGIKIKWGGEFKGFFDGPHFELGE